MMNERERTIVKLRASLDQTFAGDRDIIAKVDDLVKSMQSASVEGDGGRFGCGQKIGLTTQDAERTIERELRLPAGTIQLIRQDLKDEARGNITRVLERLAGAARFLKNPQSRLKYSTWIAAVAVEQRKKNPGQYSHLTPEEHCELILQEASA